jgi:hypothetical protein
VQPCDEDDYFCFSFFCVMEHWWDEIDGKIEVFGGKPVPMPLCSPQIPHGLTRDRTRD